MAVSIWSSVGVAMQSALAAAQTISGITKANPAVATYVGADTYNNGDYVVVSAQGMSQVDGRVFRVANVNTGSNTFELEGCDSTLFDTFVSGSVQTVTFGTTLSTLTDLSASGGDFDFIDTTTIHGNRKTQIPGAANPLSYSFGSIWDAADAALIACKAASENKALRAFRFTFANGQKFLFTGYVGTSLSPVGNAQDKVTTPVVITAFGAPTTYAT